MPLPFHPFINAWFTDNYGKPTAIQEEAWPLIAAGKDILVIAPTGSGKTLTAFLAALSRFIDGSWEPEKLCVLYVSPLKALNEDIKRNLLDPIEELKCRTEETNPVFRIRVETRSGDTPQSERRRFLLYPPSILATTPESLAILLLNPKSRAALSCIKYLVLDEIHAVLGTKRGAFLMCQIDRLKRIIEKQNTKTNSARPFQRVVLSATVNPPELAAEFAGTFNKEIQNPLTIVSPPSEKKICFKIEFMPDSDDFSKDSSQTVTEISLSARYGLRYAALIKHILERIKSHNNGTILVFTDSRRRAERITYLLNETAGMRIALCHHGSLSKEVRLEVEQSLVKGLISCVVATSSLELGLDIGEVNEVILAGTPSLCSRTLQRIGRSGHGVGEESRGTLYPFHAMDLLSGAVMAGAVKYREIEKIKPVKNPLDILSQILLALCTEETFTRDELYREITSYGVFSTLSRSSFEAVISMLTGKYFTETRPFLNDRTRRSIPALPETGESGNGLRLRELKPRLYRDIDGKLYAAEGTLAMLYSSGGVIPNRGLYSMRLPDGTKIGELDEEFVFERRNGDSFDFGGRSWTITEIGSEAVIVNPLNESADFQPFWKADTVFRSAELCRRTLEFFGAFNANGSLLNREFLGKDAAAVLEDFLFRQRTAQGNIPLPDQRIIPVEIINDFSFRPDAFQIVFHSFRGGGVNYPFAMALSSIIEAKTGIRCEAVPDDNAVLLQLPRIAAEVYSGRMDPLPLIKDCITLLGTEGEIHFKKRLESSGIFGAAFREAAERSMILTRPLYGKRIPLWVMRQKAKRLFDRVSSYGDFPVVTEAWRSCLADQFDMESFRLLLDNIAEGTIELQYFQNNSASPFARDLSWKEINSFMYEYDERKDLLGIAGRNREALGIRTTAGAFGSISDSAVAAALNEPSLRPVIGKTIIESFLARQRRELPGYAPEDLYSLLQWVKDRIAIPQDEWETLLAVLPEDLQKQLASDNSLGGRLLLFSLPDAAIPIVIHTETESVLKEEPVLACLSSWLGYEGPVLPERIRDIFGSSIAETKDALDALAETGELIGEIKIEGNKELCYCDAENYELLLRLNRKKMRPQIREMPVSFLVPFIASRQGLIKNFDTNCLSCYPAPVRLWETEIFPARDPKYKPEQLDVLLKNGSLVWFGRGSEKAAFAVPEELELAGIFDYDPAENLPDSGYKTTITGICTSYRDFWEIKNELENHAKKSLLNDEVTDILWDMVWQGMLSSDSWESIRRGIIQGFSISKEQNNMAPSKLPGIVTSFGKGQRLPRVLRDKWREGPPVKGRWYSLDAGFSGQLTALEKEDLNCSRVRLLLRRWGILCRSLLEMESLFSWQELLPAMRRMELRGELVTGRFFEGIPSLQFASPSIIQELQAAEASESVYWMNAADPASPAAWNISGLPPLLPPRNSASRICFKGKDLAAISYKNGKELVVFAEPDDPDIANILNFILVPRRRSCYPVKKIVLETINGKTAATSPFAPVLEGMGFIADREKLFLW